MTTFPAGIDSSDPAALLDEVPLSVAEAGYGQSRQHAAWISSNYAIWRPGAQLHGTNRCLHPQPLPADIHRAGTSRREGRHHEWTTRDPLGAPVRARVQQAQGRSSCPPISYRSRGAPFGAPHRSELIRRQRELGPCPGRSPYRNGCGTERALPLIKWLYPLPKSACAGRGSGQSGSIGQWTAHPL